MATQPIVQNLQQHLPRYFPVLLDNARTLGTHRSGVGGYNPDSRTHADGLAADIFLDARIADQRVIGDALFRMFSEWHLQLGVEYVMWNIQIWSRTHPRVRPQTWSLQNARTRHENHLHVQHLASWAARRPPLVISLSEEVRQRLQAGGS